MVSISHKHLARLTIGLALIVSGLLLVVPAGLAGGWAVITVDALPTQIEAEQALEIGFMVRQHGQTPLEGLSPQVKAIQQETRASLTVAAHPQGEVGHYVAELTFPEPGQWDWSIQAFTMDEAMPSLKVLAAGPAETTKPEQPWTPLLAGVLGVVGTAGTGLVWWRKRTWWTLPLAVVALAVGIGGFAQATGNQSHVEPPQTDPVLSQAEIGADLFVAKGCVTCHQHNDIDSRSRLAVNIGPNLTNVSVTPDYLKIWLHDPTTIRPQTQMPNLHLSESEIEALSAFLLGPDAASDKPLSQAADRQSDRPANQQPNLFFVRADGANGPLIAYDMSSQQEYFRLPPGLPAADQSRYYSASLQEGKTNLQVYRPDSGELADTFIIAGQWRLSGVSPTGRWLVLTGVESDQEQTDQIEETQEQTQIQIIDAQTGQSMHRADLAGNFEVETISADGRSLFLIEHLPADGPDRYLVRLYDVSASRLQEGALRDKTATEQFMTGLAWGGIASPDGRWLLTLYLNTERNVAFIHALNLEEKFPVCIFLPSGSGDVEQLKYYSLTLAPDGRTIYAANAVLGIVAEVSLDSAQVTRQIEFPGSVPPVSGDISGTGRPTGLSVISQNGQTLYFTNGREVWRYQAGQVDGPLVRKDKQEARLEGLGLSADEQQLYLAPAGEPPIALDLTNKQAFSFSSPQKF